MLLLGAMTVLFGCSSDIEDQTRKVASTCEIHHLPMTKTNVPITYGLIRLNEWGKALYTASSNNFPHASEDVLAGCLVGDDSPSQATIYVCSQCQEARKQWVSENPSPW